MEFTGGANLNMRTATAILVSRVLCIGGFILPSSALFVAHSCTDSPVALLVFAAALSLFVVSRSMGDYQKDLHYYSDKTDLSLDSDQSTLIPCPGRRSGIFRLFFLHPMAFVGGAMMGALSLFELFYCL